MTAAGDGRRVRLAIAGLGNMGSAHARSILASRIPRLDLAAVIDADPARTAAFPDVPSFTTLDACLAAGVADAVLVATPHYAHRPLGEKVLGAGIPLLMEKPLAPHKADAEALLAAHRDPAVVFGAMLNQRTDPGFRRLRELIRSGETGRILRVQWTVTHWFRPAAYYASGGWRATWKGEGGGVLINQSPHQLDVFWWLFGLPSRVRAFCRFGRYHAIEVEDDVTAYFEFPDGGTAVFITSTGESPGTNRLEIAADRGRLVLEGGRLSFDRLSVDSLQSFSAGTREMFGKPEMVATEVPIPAGPGGQHVEILTNFADAILDGTPLIAPAAEAIHSLELANAMLLSTWLDRTVEIPIDSSLYAAELEKRISK